MNPGEIGSGVLVDGWSFVWMAYVASWIVLTGYTASLWTRSQSMDDS
jgi:hypothetical protein